MQTFADGDELQVGRTRLQVIHTPGHTPGHSCFYFPEHDILYLADIDLTPFGPWYGDQTSDLNALLDSLQRLEDFQARVYLTAHGQGVFSGEEAKAALVRFKQVILDREAEISDSSTDPGRFLIWSTNDLIYRNPGAGSLS